jgi:uncharacterized protein YbjT (DUF2867 family)
MGAFDARQGFTSEVRNAAKGESMILITGAGGTVGGELVKRLKDSKVQFRVAFHSSEKAERAAAAGMDAVVMDFQKPATIAPALRGVEKLFLLSPPNQPELEKPVVEEARKAGVRHLVKLSSWGAESEAYTFGRDHRAIEKLIEASKIPFTFLRPNGFMQNFLSLAATIKGQRAIHFPAGDSRYSMIDVRDVAAVALRVLAASAHQGKAYRLSGPESLSHEDVAEKLSRVLGRKITYLDSPPAEFKKALLGFGLDEPYAESILDLYRYYQTGAAAAVTPDVEHVTGKKPTSFEQFVRDHAGAFE